MKKRTLEKQHFAKLSEYGLLGMATDACMCLRFKPGETILQEGLPISWLGIILSGKVKVCSTAPNGKHLILCYYVSAGIIGDIELMAGTSTATATVIAITDFECIAIPYKNYGTALKMNVEFLNQLGRQLSLKLLESSNSFVSTALYSGEERLCSYILQTSSNGLFSDVLTDVSYSIGMSYRHMFRLLNQLCEDRVLEKQADGYRIVNRDTLARRAMSSLHE